jgi:hypothetical protein
LDYSKKELAEIWNKLNGWEWDDRLGERPDGWNEMPRSSKGTKFSKYFYIKPYIEQVREKAGEKGCLKYHHLYNLKRSRIQFEVYWIKRQFRRFFLGSPI